MIPCILHPSRSRRGNTPPSTRCVAIPIPLISLPFSTVYFRQQRRRFIDSRNLCAYEIRRIHSRELLRNRLLVARVHARTRPLRIKSRNILSDFAVTPPKNFSPELADISLVRCYWLYCEMESIYNFANGHSVLPLATSRYQACEAYFFETERERGSGLIARYNK